MSYYTLLDSPVGMLRLTSDGKALTGLDMLNDGDDVSPGKGWIQKDDLQLFQSTRRQLGEYFAGKRRDFDLPLSMEGTEFRRRVWQELTRIPYGTTISYGELAHRVGNDKASRAVGLANGCNPIGIIVPCHRVIGANGTLTGYGGGLERKRILLDLEASNRLALATR
jgi:methylated-DNA-[protein]-cysteine S-methyltransferase